MQSLWSRAGLARHRGCRAYTTAVVAAARRRTATAARRRRKPTFAEVFTACYGSVFVTATLVDAVRKDNRRRELDRQLEEARAELQQLREKGASDDCAGLPDITDKQMHALWRSLKIIYRHRPYMKEIHKPATTSVSEFLASLKSECYDCPAEAAMQTVRQTDYERLQQAIMAEEVDQSIPSREPRNGIQLLRETWSIKHLVLQLLRRAEIADKGEMSSRSFDEACELADQGFPDYTFRSIDPERAANNTLLLNRCLRSLADAPSLGLKERVGRICFNLLVSAHAPDMHTYNTLIVAFDKGGHHDLADVLVHSFFHERLIRPTPSTFVAILNHYKATGNHGQYLRALACLTGADARTGGKVARRHILDVNSSRVLGKWASNTRLRTRTGDWVWEHVPLHRALLEEVIAGLLHFKLFEHAAAFFITCVKTGVALSTEAAKQVLDECLVALDWRGAYNLIRGFITHKHKWKRLLTGDGSANSYLISRIYALLDLCGLQGPGQPVSRPCLANLHISASRYGGFLKDLDMKRLEVLGLPPDGVEAQSGEDEGSVARPKSMLLQMESIWKEYVHVRKTTKSIESKLLYPDFSVRFRVAMALHIGGAAAEASRQLVQDFAELVSGSVCGWPPLPPPQPEPEPPRRPPPPHALDEGRGLDEGLVSDTSRETGLPRGARPLGGFVARERQAAWVLSARATRKRLVRRGAGSSRSGGRRKHDADSVYAYWS